MVRRAAARLLVFAALALTWPAFAHEGHDHPEPQGDDDDAPALSAPPPAVAISTPQVEVVLTREHGELLIYVDDYASNSPLDGLQVRVQSGSRLLLASAVGDGVYRVPGELADAGTGAPLTLLLHGEGLDLRIQASLPAAPSADAAGAAAAPARSLPLALIAAAVGALLLALLWRTSRRRRIPRV